MNTKLTPKQTQILDIALHKADINGDKKVKVDANGNYIRTPWDLCAEIVEQIKTTAGDLTAKKVLVVDTVEFIPVLMSFGVNSSNITYVASYTHKGNIARSLGARVEQTSLLKWENNMKFDVVVGNPPYTDGTHAANEIYSQISERIFTLAEPSVMAMITPENFLNGLQKKKQVREKILKSHYFSYVNFLNQQRDWNDTIKVDTAAWIVTSQEVSSVSVIGRNSGKKYTSKPLHEYVNGEDQTLHNWLQSIQTSTKLKLIQSRKTNRAGKELKISKSSPDSAHIIDGNEYESHNSEWRVAFGYMRANTCAIVAPGISIPRKYKYAKFGSNEVAARKFAAYMLTGPIRLILKLTYTSRTLDNPQLSYVPVINFDDFATIDDQTLLDYWGKDISNYINNIVGNEVPF